MFETTLHLSSGDIMLRSALSPDRYKLVKYEELVSDPKRTMLDLYSFAGITVTQQMLVSINQHFNAELLYKKRYAFFSSIFQNASPNLRNGKRPPVSGMLSVFRKSTYNNSELRSLPNEVKTKIENKCSKLLDILNYT